MSEHVEYEISDYIDYGPCKPKLKTSDILIGGIQVTGKIALGILRLSAKAAKGMYNIIEKEHQRRVEAEKERKIIERNNLQRHNSETLKEVINTINGVQEIMRQIQSTGKGNQNTRTAFVKQSSFEVQARMHQ